MEKKINIINDCRGMDNEEIIEKVFEGRNIHDVEHFLNPTHDDMLPFESLYRIDEAAKIVIDGIKNRKKFMVYYDVDCDGISSGIIITRYLKDFGIDPKTYINNGKNHGVTEDSLKYINDIDILIVVDSLNSDIELYKKIREKGVEIIVLDHHDIKENIPYDEYVVLVSSNRNYKNKELSGAGVSMKFILYLDSLFGTIEADKYYDLAACGILADVMLVDEQHMENRYIVKRGLENINNSAIKKIIGSYKFDSNSVLFSIAPLINASMRYDKNQYAMDLFLSEDVNYISKCLNILKSCKEKQTEEIKNLIPDLIEQAEKQKDNNVLFLVVDTESGISGLLATKILDLFSKPTIVVKETHSGYAGSLRADGCDFKSLCESTKCGIFSGHEMAAGVFINYDKTDEFIKKINKLVEGVKFKKEINVDLLLDVADVNTTLLSYVKEIDFVSGNGFKPISVLIECDDYEVSTMSKGKHLVIKPSFYNGFQFIKWNAGDKEDEFEDHEVCGDKLSFTGSLDMGYIGRNFSCRLICNDIIVN